MGNVLHLQMQLTAAPAAVFRALTDDEALMRWFAEHAAVNLAAKRYDFWGRFTPDTPDRGQGQNQLLEVVPNRVLRYTWQVRGYDTEVGLELEPEANGTRLTLKQSGASSEAEFNIWAAEDFWFLSLENLRRYLDGRDVVRCDYSAFKLGDITWEMEIDARPEDVFEALIRPEQLNRWIASEAEVEAKVGGDYDYGWGTGPAKILELVPGEKLRHSWGPWGDQPATVVTWTLAGSGGKTRLTLVHSGFAPDQEGAEQEGWLKYMLQIKSLVEYGIEWQVPVKELSADMVAYYPATIGQAQGLFSG